MGGSEETKSMKCCCKFDVVSTQLLMETGANLNPTFLHALHISVVISI